MHLTASQAVHDPDEQGSAFGCAGFTIQLCQALDPHAELSIQLCRIHYPAVPGSSYLCEAQQQPTWSSAPGQAASRCAELSLQVCWIYNPAVPDSSCLCKNPASAHAQLGIRPHNIQMRIPQHPAVPESYPAVQGSSSPCRTRHQASTARHPAVRHPAVQSMRAQHAACRIQHPAVQGSAPGCPGASWPCRGTGLDVCWTSPLRQESRERQRQFTAGG